MHKTTKWKGIKWRLHTHYCIHCETQMKVKKGTVKLFLCMP